MEGRLAKRRRRAKTREEKLIASQAAEIAALKAQVKALKALGALAGRTQRAPQATEKSERFEVIFRLRTDDPAFNVSAACEALEVSRRGYWPPRPAAPHARRPTSKRKSRPRPHMAVVASRREAVRSSTAFAANRAS